MPSTIKLTFFFLHRQIEKLIVLSKSRKKQYYIAPLLPAIATIFTFYVLINNQLSHNWLICIYILFFIISLIFTFLLTVSSVFFLNGKNIFEESRFYDLLKQSNASFIRNKKSLKLPTGKIFRSKKRLERINIEVVFLSQKAYPSNSMLFLNENCKKINNNKSKFLEGVTEQESIVFNDEQLKMIEQVFLSLKKTVLLKKPIISDENTLEDFIITIKSLGLRRRYPFIMLELESQYCEKFLSLFFIPFLELLTKKNFDRKDVTILFKYKKKNGFKELKEGSISKKDRQLSTEDQKLTYSNLLNKLQ
jgi:hypothetical protein